MLALRGPTARQARADSPEQGGEEGGAEAGAARADNPAGRADSPGAGGGGSGGWSLARREPQLGRQELKAKALRGEEPG